MSETKWQRARQLLERTHGLLSSGYGIDPLMKAQLLDDLEAWNSQDTAAAPEPSADDVRAAKNAVKSAKYALDSYIFAVDPPEPATTGIALYAGVADAQTMLIVALEAQNAALVKALRNALKQGYDAYRMTPGIHTASFAEWCGEDYRLVEATVEESDDADAG